MVKLQYCLTSSDLVYSEWILCIILYSLSKGNTYWRIALNIKFVYKHSSTIRNIVHTHSIQNTVLSAKMCMLFSCNDVLKIHKRTINTHRYLLDMRITLQFTLNWILKIQFDGRYLCSLRARMEFSNKEKSLCVYVYLFVRVHVHNFNALMGLSPYIWTLISFFISFTKQSASNLLLRIFFYI